MTAYKYPSQILQKLKPALDELTERGYLAGVDTEKAEDGSAIVLFRFAESFPAHYPIQNSVPLDQCQKRKILPQQHGKKASLPFFSRLISPTTR